MMPQFVAVIVEPDRVRQFPVQRRHDLTPRRERSRFPFYTMLRRQLFHKTSRDKIAQLINYTQSSSGWS